MPLTMPLRLSRRTLLAGAAGVGGAALLTGCSDGADRAGAEPGVPLERRMRASAVRDSERLLERYDTTAAAHPGLAGRLAPLRASVAAHAAALASPDGGVGEPSATASAAASPAPAGAAAPSGQPVAARPEEALTELADAERSLAEARTVALAGAPGELARLLASVAACGAVHAYLLTSNPGVAP